MSLRQHLPRMHTALTAGSGRIKVPFGEIRVKKGQAARTCPVHPRTIMEFSAAGRQGVGTERCPNCYAKQWNAENTEKAAALVAARNLANNNQTITPAFGTTKDVV